MSDDEIPYAKVRKVRDETGASHAECRQVLEASNGDVNAAISLWFTRKRGAAPEPPHGGGLYHTSAERNS